jgi:hypothetical protein
MEDSVAASFGHHAEFCGVVRSCGHAARQTNHVPHRNQTRNRSGGPKIMTQSHRTAKRQSLVSATLLRSRGGAMAWRLSICWVAFCICSCWNSEPGVLKMTYPIYPVTAQCHRVQGDVDLIVQIGVDGKVLLVMDAVDRRGVDPDLREASMENARQWIWGPFPPRFQFPWNHSIRYSYKLQGKPTVLPVFPAVVRTDLPNRVDIIALPCTVSPFNPPLITPSAKPD